MRALSTRALGVGFLLVLALLVGLAVASYAKVFTPVVTVSLQTNRIGNQLSPRADVKIRGLIVGEVRAIGSRGDGATLSLALDPDHVDAIPANVEARLLPKTLFGEKFVSLVVPDVPAERHIREGDVIGQDRSQTAIELEQVLDNVLPLLRAVQPADLAATLNALSTALEGRGDALGANLTLVDDYLTRLNERLPTIQADISGLADLASLYADAAPDLLRLLPNLAVTSATLVEKQDVLASFLAGTAGFATTTNQVLTENEQRIVQLGRVSRPTLAVLARYAPEYPCLLRGMDQWRPRINEAFGDNRLNITLEVSPQRDPYAPGDEPAFDEHRGPVCFGLPTPAHNQADPFPGVVLRDGSGGSGYHYSRVPGGFSDTSSGLAGSLAEQRVVGALIAAPMGTDAGSVPAIGTLLMGPMLRGMRVSTR